MGNVSLGFNHTLDAWNGTLETDLCLYRWEQEGDGPLAKGLSGAQLYCKEFCKTRTKGFLSVKVKTEETLHLGQLRFPVKFPMNFTMLMQLRQHHSDIQSLLIARLFIPRL